MSTETIDFDYNGVPFKMDTPSGMSEDEKRKYIEDFFLTSEGQNLFEQKQTQLQNNARAADIENEITKDAQEFTPRKALEGAGYLSAYTTQGLVGNLIDLPFAIGNMVISASNSLLGTNIQEGAFGRPTREFLGADTGKFFDPQRVQASEEVKEKLRPLGVGLEFATSFTGPQAILKGVAGAKTAPQITETASSITTPTTSLLKGRQAVTPTAITRAKLPAGSTAVPGTISQQMTTQGANLANTLTSGLSGVGAGTASYMFRDSENRDIAELVGGIGSPIAAISGAKLAQYGASKIHSKKLLEDLDIEAAFNIIAQNADNPVIAKNNYVKNYKAGKRGNLADMTEDQGIASLVNSVSSKSGKARDRLLKVQQDRDELFYNTLNNLTDEQADLYFKTFLENENKAFVTNLQNQLNAAKNKAEVDLERATRGLEDPSVASKSFYDELKKITDKTDEYISDMWSKVPNPFVNRKGVDKFANLALTKNLPIKDGRGTRILADQDKTAIGTTFDPFIKTLVGTAEKGRVKAEELIKFRSNILKKIRELQAKKESNLTIEAYGQQLQNDAMDLLLKSKAGQSYKRASNLTREIKNTLNRAYFNLDDDPALIGAKVFSGKEAGLRNAEDLAAIQGFDPESGGLFKALEQVARTNFKNVAVKEDGTIDLNRAVAFLNKHAETLAKPELRAFKKEIDDAIASGRQSAQMEQTKKSAEAYRAKQKFIEFSTSKRPRRGG